MDKWTMEMDHRGLYNGERPLSGRDRKILKRERLEKIYCRTRKNIPSEIAYPFKNLLSDLNSTSDYVRISPTLLQIYCIELIVPISYSFWVCATICDLTSGCYFFFFFWVIIHFYNTLRC